MLKLFATAIIAFTMSATTMTAHATVLRLPHKPFNHMTRTEKIHYLKRQKWHDNSIIRWWHHHRELASTEATKNVKWAYKSLSIVKRNLRKLRSVVLTTGYPPHHALWVCIGSIEGSPTSVNPNGHYGMLQMTYNWFNLIKGRASDYSQAIQEWAAEKAYKANHYSFAFLWGQWYKWENGVGSKCYKYD